jgi:hypothetical protein
MEPLPPHPGEIANEVPWLKKQYGKVHVNGSADLVQTRHCCATPRRSAKQHSIALRRSTDHPVAQMCDEAGVLDLERFERDVADTFEQPLPGAEQYRRHVQPQLVEQARP